MIWLIGERCALELRSHAGGLLANIAMGERGLLLTLGDLGRAECGQRCAAPLLSEWIVSAAAIEHEVCLPCS